MYKVNQKTDPNIFLSRLQKPSHFYQTRFYVLLIHDIKTSKHSISIREPYIWNSFLGAKEKKIITMHKFKAMTKSRLLLLENEYFSRGYFFLK